MHNWLIDCWLEEFGWRLFNGSIACEHLLYSIRFNALTLGRLQFYIGITIFDYLRTWKCHWGSNTTKCGKVYGVNIFPSITNTFLISHINSKPTAGYQAHMSRSMLSGSQNHWRKCSVILLSKKEIHNLFWNDHFINEFVSERMNVE